GAGARGLLSAVPRLARVTGRDILVEVFRHNAMMNGRLMEACRQRSPEQLGATATGTYGTIGATLVHIANSQEGYAARLLDTERPERLPEDPFPGFDALSERIAHGNTQLEEGATHAAEDRRVEVTGDDPPGTWWMSPLRTWIARAVRLPCPWLMMPSGSGAMGS